MAIPSPTDSLRRPSPSGDPMGGGARPESPGVLGWWSYLLLLVVSIPVWGPLATWRLLRSESREEYRERLGRGAPLPEPHGPRVWLHGASVGEIQALEPVILALRSMRPGAELVVTTTSRTGQKRAQALFGEMADVRYAPLDLPWCAAAACRRISPSLLVLAESELWPALLRTAARTAPVILVNGRISDRTWRRARLLRTGYGWMLRHLWAACARSPEDAARLQVLGMEPGRIHLTGDVKYDRATPLPDPGKAHSWRVHLGLGDDPLLVAGSTFPGEEDILMDAFSLVRNRVPGARLLLAPRDTRRASRVLAAARRRGFEAVLRSTCPSPSFVPDLVVLDTMGELSHLYGIGEMAFVGRSLARGGGQNPMEPLAAGVPVLHGPRMENFREVTERASMVGAGRTVTTPESLAAAWTEWLEDPAARRAAGERGRSMVESGKGAASRTALLLADLLPASQPPVPADLVGGP